MTAEEVPTMTVSPRWFTHANVNTADLPRAEAFYTEVLGLVPRARTAPSAAQDGSGFAMPGVMVRWEGVLLGDYRTPRGPVVDLLQWMEPPTEGKPATGPTHIGLSALRFGLADLDATAERLVEGGGSYERIRHEDPAGSRQVIIATDADGTRLELMEHVPEQSPMYQGVRINCTDLERSLAFYTTGFGLVADDVRTVSVLAEAGPAGRFRVASAYVPGQRDEFTLELTQWEDPPTVGTPPGSGNPAGIYRVAVVVRDIAESHRQVLEVLPTGAAPVRVTVFDDQPPLLASFYPDPDGAIAELIEPSVPRE
jgi:catechol 2,3-dioxygenase-like lactoylglutathione lyase family enzyme